jgi:DNA-binding FadR family transcriptional regulator
MLAVDLQMQQVTYGDLEQASEFIEPVLAGWLARTRTKDDLVALRDLVDRATAAAAACDLEEFSKIATEFHEEIIARAGNKTLATLSRLLHELRADYYSWASSRSADQPQLQRAARSYRRLVLLIEAGDSAGAAEHWRRQLDYMLAETPDHDTVIPFT